MRLVSYLAVAVLHVAARAAAASCPVADTSIIAHEGTPVGKEEVHNGVNLYISTPGCSTTPKAAAVLYLTDVFGIQLAQNKLLADSFARAGYLTVAPDLFNGTPAPSDINTGGFNTTQFLAAHGANVTDPIIAAAVAYMRQTLGVKTIAATGYCYGGRYAFRAVAPGQGADVAFAAHPSLLEDGEIRAIAGPASVAAADSDSMMPPARRAQIEALLLNTTLPYQVALYGGTSHGFGVRANVSDPQQRFGKESAFFQAVRWFDAWA